LSAKSVAYQRLWFNELGHASEKPETASWGPMGPSPTKLVERPAHWEDGGRGGLGPARPDLAAVALPGQAGVFGAAGYPPPEGLQEWKTHCGRWAGYSSHRRADRT
jgi:hypothetical protein